MSGPTGPEPTPSGSTPAPNPGDPRYRWHPNVASRVLDGMAFILLNTRMLRLNEVGTRMWELFENGATLSSVAHAITLEYDITADVAAGDTERFAAQLVERGLLVLDQPSS